MRTFVLVKYEGFPFESVFYGSIYFCMISINTVNLPIDSLHIQTPFVLALPIWHGVDISDFNF